MTCRQTIRLSDTLEICMHVRAPKTHKPEVWIYEKNDAQITKLHKFEAVRHWGSFMRDIEFTMTQSNEWEYQYPGPVTISPPKIKHMKRDPNRPGKFTVEEIPRPVPDIESVLPKVFLEMQNMSTECMSANATAMVELNWETLRILVSTQFHIMHWMEDFERNKRTDEELKCSCPITDDEVNVEKCPLDL